MSSAPDSAPLDQRLQVAASRIQAMARSMEAVLFGQSEPIRHLLVALVAGGHVLIEGLPGLGKTELVRALARVSGLRMGRIQCTPDMLPADVIGTEVPDPGAADGSFRFRPGPLFQPLLMVDEINRATPRTQSAFLQAMQEACVSYAGVDYPLPAPFLVMATQNPIELEGTYPLPEAQLDRFMFKLRVGFPGRAALDRIAALETPVAAEPVIDPATLAELGELAGQVLVAPPVQAAAVELILACQPGTDGDRAHLRYGASPRALQALLAGARAHALAGGQVAVGFDDLEAVALPVLRHRLVADVHSEMQGLDGERLASRIVAGWRQAL